MIAHFKANVVAPSARPLSNNTGGGSGVHAINITDKIVVLHELIQGIAEQAAYIELAGSVRLDTTNDTLKSAVVCSAFAFLPRSKATGVGSSCARSRQHNALYVTVINGTKLVGITQQCRSILVACTCNADVDHVHIGDFSSANVFKQCTVCQMLFVLEVALDYFAVAVIFAKKCYGTVYTDARTVYQFTAVAASRQCAGQGCFGIPVTGSAGSSLVVHHTRHTGSKVAGVGSVSYDHDAGSLIEGKAFVVQNNICGLLAIYLVTRGYYRAAALIPSVRNTLVCDSLSQIDEVLNISDCQRVIIAIVLCRIHRTQTIAFRLGLCLLLISFCGRSELLLLLRFPVLRFRTGCHGAHGEHSQHHNEHEEHT